MVFKDRIIEFIGLVSQRQLEAATQEAAHQSYINGYNDGNDEPPSGTLASYGYRQNSTGGRRDNKLSWDELVSAAWEISQINPPADRGLELKRDHILGRGIEINTKNAILDEIITNFRNTNKFDVHLREYVLQLFLFGIQCLPVSIRLADGRVKLNYIDPQQIEDIIAHPYNPTEFWAVVVKPMEGLPVWVGSNMPRRIYRIVKEDTGFVQGNRVISPNHPGRLATAEQAKLEPWESVMLAHYGLAGYTGSTFYFCINSVSNQPFFASDLQRIIYWLERLDEALLAAADRENSSGYWYNDVKITGATPEQIRQRNTELKRQPPPRGGINVHNDREEDEIKQPTASSGNVDVLNALFNHAWGGLGFPRHWYVQGDGTNKATAQEQDEPVEKTLQSDQDAIKEMIITIITFVRDQAIIAGVPGVDGELKIVMPEIASRNLERLGNALKDLTDTLDKAIVKKLISTETAREMWAKLVVELGIEVDPEEEGKRIETEKPEPTFDLLTGQPHPDADIGAAPTIEAATLIAVEKVRRGDPIDGSDSIQDEINEAVRLAQAEFKSNGKQHSITPG